MRSSSRGAAGAGDGKPKKRRAPLTSPGEEGGGSSSNAGTGLNARLTATNTVPSYSPFPRSGPAASTDSLGLHHPTYSYSTVSLPDVPYPIHSGSVFQSRAGQGAQAAAANVKAKLHQQQQQRPATSTGHRLDPSPDIYVPAAAPDVKGKGRATGRSGRSLAPTDNVQEIGAIDIAEAVRMAGLAPPVSSPPSSFLDGLRRPSTSTSSLSLPGTSSPGDLSRTVSASSNYGATSPPSLSDGFSLQDTIASTSSAAGASQKSAKSTSKIKTKSSKANTPKGTTVLTVGSSLSPAIPKPKKAVTKKKSSTGLLATSGGPPAITTPSGSTSARPTLDSPAAEQSSKVKVKKKKVKPLESAAGSAGGSSQSIQPTHRSKPQQPILGSALTNANLDVRRPSVIANMSDRPAAATSSRPSQLPGPVLAPVAPMSPPPQVRHVASASDHGRPSRAALAPPAVISSGVSPGEQSRTTRNEPRTMASPASPAPVRSPAAGAAGVPSATQARSLIRPHLVERLPSEGTMARIIPADHQEPHTLLTTLAEPDEAPRSSSPPPPPWSAPLTTITLAHTPMHAYLADFEAEVEAQPSEEAIAEPMPDSPTTAAFMNALGGSSGNDEGDSAGEAANSNAGMTTDNNLPREPDSPPPEFRSRPPTPETRPVHAGEGMPTGTPGQDAESADEGWPDIDPGAIIEAERGYASSENELDLLSSQGRNQSAVGEGVLVSDSEGDCDDGSRARRKEERRRWQLRHWEAWRREGLGMEDRLRLLASVQKKAKEEAQAARMARTAPGPVVVQTSPAAAGRQTPDESPLSAPVASASRWLHPSVLDSSAPAPATERTLVAPLAATPISPASLVHAPQQVPALTVQPPSNATTSVQRAADHVAVGSSLSRPYANPRESFSKAEPAQIATAHPSPVPTSLSLAMSSPNGHASPGQQRQISPSDIRESLSGRFPSIGSVRRARLKRFDAERQTSKTLGSVIETSPTSSSVQPPRSPSSNSGGLSPAIAASSAAPAPQSSIVDRPKTTWSTSKPLGRDSSTSAVPEAAPAESVSTVETQPTQSAAAGNAGQRPMSELVKQLTANLETRPLGESRSVSRPSTTRALQPLAQVASSAGSSASLAQRSVNVQEQAQLAPEPATVNSHAQSKITDTTPNATSGPSRTTKRIANLRKEGTKTGKKAVETDVRSPSGQRRPSTARVGVPEEEPSLPEMVLPRAPPRVTSDPLSMDNLRKLSRHQERSPSLHSTDSPSSSSEGDANEETSLSSPGEGKSDSDSDSADEDSATHKPASSLVSLPSGVGPPSTSNSTLHGYDGQKETAAASWRRTEDGKRHSAILSRPLSIKRKPPPVPAKRWGGIWESTSVQENLAKTLRLFDERPELAGRNDARTMPGALSGVAEADENTDHWETVGQPVQPLSVQPRLPNFAWETAGRDDNSNAPVLAQLAASATTRALSFLGLDGSQGFSAAAPVPAMPRRHIQPAQQHPEARRLPPVPHHPAPAAQSASAQALVPDHDPFISENDLSARRLPVQLSGQVSAAPALPSRPASIRSIDPPELADDETIAPGNPFADLTPRRADHDSAGGIYGRARSPSGSMLQRSGATRRPQSMAYPSPQSRSSDMARHLSSPSGNNPPSENVRATLNSRPRHVYSSSVPNATLPPSSPKTERARPRRPLPIPPISEDPFTAPVTAANEQYTMPLANDTLREPVDSVEEIPPPQNQSDVTDLEVMISQMEDRGTENSSQLLDEVLGTTRPATAEEIDSLPVGRVELERRRIDKKGKMKQKHSCLGMTCNRCSICLTQFKEDELAAVLPLCCHVFHAEPCIRSYFLTNNRCPTCQVPLVPM